jgi:hypothetical protein
MTFFQSLGRRGFLKSALAMAGALGTPEAPLWEGRGHPDPGTRLSRLIGARESARAIGTAYLKVTPGEQASGALSDALTRNLADGREALSALDDAALRLALSIQVRRDFETSDVIELEGWVLSRTEARLCALVAIQVA